MSDLTFFKCSGKELQIVAHLAHEIWNEHYPSIIGQNQVDYMLSTLYKIDTLENQLINGQEFYIILEKKEIIGFFSVTNMNSNDLFINKLYIKSRRKGLGYKTLAWIEENYPNKNTELTVNRQNYQAINFYFKNGFVIKKVADFDIGNGYYMNDFVMKKER